MLVRSQTEWTFQWILYLKLWLQKGVFDSLDYWLFYKLESDLCVNGLKTKTIFFFSLGWGFFCFVCKEMFSLEHLFGAFSIWASVPSFLMYLLFYSSFEDIDPEGPIKDTKVKSTVVRKKVNSISIWMQQEKNAKKELVLFKCIVSFPLI